MLIFKGCFTCCMESGLRIFNVEPLVEKSFYGLYLFCYYILKNFLFLDIESVGSVSQCEMLFRTNLLAITSGGSRPKFADNVLLIYDDLTKKFILDITFGSSIRAVRMKNDK